MRYENETNAGAAYLSRLKQSNTPQAAGAAPARARDATASAASAPHRTRSEDAAPPKPISAPMEKRRSPRYKCQGSACIQEIGRPGSTWATFTDISVHGCYVEAPVPYRVGVILQMRLELNDFRIELAGKVCVAYPSLGMGVSFTEISPPNHKRLRELVASLAAFQGRQA